MQAIVSDDTNLVDRDRDPARRLELVYEPENILLLGSDTRAGAANSAAGGTDGSTSDGVANSDTQMIAHVSGDRQHVTVLSIPRDTMIDAPTCKSWDAATGQLSEENYPVQPGDRWHINSAYSVGGPQCSVRAIQDLTGLRIDRVIGIDFAGFQNMVDALGGVTVNVCGRIDDAELGVVVADGGVQTIKGDQALSLVRARKVKGDTDSDLARIRRQQIVLSAILQQVTSAGTLLNPVKLDAFLQAFVTNTFTDNVSIDDLVTLAQSFGSLDPSRVTFFTLPTVPSESNPDALDVDETKAPAVFDALTQRPPAARRTVGRGDTGRVGLTDRELAGHVRRSEQHPGFGHHRRPGLGRPDGGERQRPVRGGDRGDGAAERHGLRCHRRPTCWRRTATSSPGVTVEYDPANLAAALTVAATVEGADAGARPTGSARRSGCCWARPSTAPSHR